ncbi:MAG: hypothetical protein ABEJ28_10765 [Salinigranum sp.]
MSETSHDDVGAAAADLFDKYLLPKAALTIILTASLVGTAVAVRLSTDWTWGIALAKWGYFVALGTLTGGLVWKHAFVRPSDVGAAVEGYCRRMYDRFDRIALLAVGVLAVTALVVLPSYPAPVRGGPWWTLAFAGVVLLGALAVLTALRSAPPDEQFRSPTGVLALAAALIAVVGSARLEVLLRSGGVVAFGVRTLHLLAFGVWVGGAVWNIFVAVPSGQTRPTVPVIRAAGEQLERFRWAVRIIIPTLLLTGLLQSVEVFGLRLAPYVETAVGLAVLAKVGLVALLVGIFVTCPMWRACSPIDGVCELEDLEDDHADRRAEVAGDA